MRTSRLFLAFALLLIVGSCADTSAPHDDRLGRYVLRSINGEPLPALVLQNAVARLEFIKGALRINKDGTFTDSTDLKVTPLGGGDIRRTIDVAAGSYRIKGDTVFFDSTRGEHYHMVFQVSGSLTQILAGARLLYRK